MIRGSEDANKQMIEHPSFSTGSKLAFILRPKSEIVKDLKIKVFAFSAGNIKALNLKVQSDIDGNIRIFGNLGTDFSLNSGKWTIAILLGPEKSISNQEKLIKYLTPGKKAGKDEDIIWFKRTVLINNAK